MLNDQDNELLTRIGPGTPAGELLRRYWHPISGAGELTEQNPTKFVIILGEDLVLFKDKKGRVGLLADRCSHRGASLSYGRVEERGIACAYHGWLFDTEGNCLECPAEHRESRFHLTVKHRAYPVQKFIGLYWTYMGPLPAPVIPKIDVWVRKDGIKKLTVRPQLDCNWLQAMENSMDPAHLQILHQEVTNRGRQPPSTTRGFTDDIVSFDFYLVPNGIMKKRIYTNGFVDEHPLIFPNILREGSGTHIRVPMDDTHTRIFHVNFEPLPEEGAAVGEETEQAIVYLNPFKNPPQGLHPFARFRMDRVDAQDYMAWESQGPIANRSTERLATSDRGIELFRQTLKENIEKVQKGLDPLGVIRDPAHMMIDTKLSESLEQMASSGRIRRRNLAAV